MKGKVSVAPDAITTEHSLPARVQEPLGELVGVPQEGLLALSVGALLGVLAELMAEEVTEVVGIRPTRTRSPSGASARRPSAT